MAEKADLPTDTVSLPPTYAPSETYTESPPPAYRRGGMAAVRIARLVCCTLLAMTFIVGFFVISHKYIQSRSCDCHTEVSALKTAALLGAPSFRLDNNRIEEEINLKAVESAIGVADKDDEMEQGDDQIIGEPVKEEKAAEAEFNFEEKLEQLTNDLRLPKGLLVGNPKLAGKDVQCKVEKRQQKIAEGVISQAIIVTCDDNDDDDEESDEGNSSEEEFNENRIPFQMEGPKPPMSLFSSIMKILASRPSMRDNEPMVRPRMIPIFRAPHRPLPPSFPMRPPFAGPVGPPMIPIHRIPMNIRIPNREEENSPMPIILQRPPPEIIQGRSPRMNVLPPLRLIQRPVENNIRRFPVPFPNNLPIRIVRIPPPEIERENENEMFPNFDENENDNDLPPQIHPFLRLLPPPNRFLHIRPMPTPEGMSNGENRPFPFHHEEEEEQMPHPMPEATGRALPSPIEIPGLRVVRLPLMPQNRPFPEAQLMTHMEVNAAENEENNQQQIHEEEPIINEPRPIEDNIEFGPPKIHTLINQEQAPLPESLQDLPEPEFNDNRPIIRPFLPLFPFPRPSFAPEGRISQNVQINPEAEILPVERPQEQVPESQGAVLN